MFEFIEGKWMFVKKTMLVAIPLSGLLLNVANAQTKALTNTSNSNYAKLQSVDMGAVKFTDGFWAERLQVCKDAMVPSLWHTYTSDISHAYQNFRITAGLDTGSHIGPTFHDGDFYKVIEAVARLYASTGDKKLDLMMDSVIATLQKAQRNDGYIYTVAQIADKKNGTRTNSDEGLSFEAYNFGHLMTAACIHYRVTGKTNLLDIAKKATAFLYNFYMHASPDVARNAICPSHYMGVVEMYRTLGDTSYLTFAKHLIDIKGMAHDGTDDNQDRIPFRHQHKAMGHAVRANYLYAGVADVYTETGDTTLINRLYDIWDDMVNTKTYITGGCGALYDGVSPYGTSYSPPFIQKTHQAFGRDFQLPNVTAYNETCANIGNMLWNWRMLQATAQAKYADMMELDLYNSILSGISLDGTKYFYTNPLAQSDKFPYVMRWSGGRIPYIALSNCCPPNIIRTITEVSDYAYSLGKNALYVNLYGASNLNTKLNGQALQVSQQTDYPWNGNISLKLIEAPSEAFELCVRIPGWSSGAQLLVNGKPANVQLVSGEYASVKRSWKKGDEVKLLLPMTAQLIEANPLVEESRNQVAVKRGPLVYCIESADYPASTNVFDVVLPSNVQLSPLLSSLQGASIVKLTGTAWLRNKADWNNTLYKKLDAAKGKQIQVNLIPYYAWANRGKTEMSVWLPYR